MRWLRGLGSRWSWSALVACGMALSACGAAASPATKPPATFSPVTAAPVTVPRGSAPLDFRRVRLWVPPTWAKRWTPTLPCEPATDQDVVFTGPGPHAPHCAAAALGDWVLIEASNGAPPATATKQVVNGLTLWSFTAPAGARAYAIPSLHTTVVAAGAEGRAVQDSVQPSALETVLTARYPVAVPAAWDHRSYHGQPFATPRSWPAQTLGPDATPPGFCSEPVSTAPIVFEGTGRQFPGPVSCPAIAVEPVVDPVDGIWLQPWQNGSSPPDPVPQLRTRPGPARLVYSFSSPGDVDTIRLLIHSGDQKTEVTIGLGADPTTAEEVLSSLGVTGGPLLASPTQFGKSTSG
jgi:hypothetical protein